jgi:hypothetical protein
MEVMEAAAILAALAEVVLVALYRFFTRLL